MKFSLSDRVAELDLAIINLNEKIESEVSPYLKAKLMRQVTECQRLKLLNERLLDSVTKKDK